MKVMREILKELILIRKELQAIHSDLEPSKKILIDEKKINRQLGELHMKTARQE